MELEAIHEPVPSKRGYAVLVSDASIVASDIGRGRTEYIESICRLQPRGKRVGRSVGPARQWQSNAIDEEFYGRAGSLTTESPSLEFSKIGYSLRRKIELPYVVTSIGVESGNDRRGRRDGRKRARLHFHTAKDTSRLARDTPPDHGSLFGTGLGRAERQRLFQFVIPSVYPNDNAAAGKPIRHDFGDFLLRATERGKWFLRRAGSSIAAIGADGQFDTIYRAFAGGSARAVGSALLGSDPFGAITVFCDIGLTGSARMRSASPTLGTASPHVRSTTAARAFPTGPLSRVPPVMSACARTTLAARGRSTSRSTGTRGSIGSVIVGTASDPPQESAYRRHGE